MDELDPPWYSPVGPKQFTPPPPPRFKQFLTDKSTKTPNLPTITTPLNFMWGTPFLGFTLDQSAKYTETSSWPALTAHLSLMWASLVSTAAEITLVKTHFCCASGQTGSSCLINPHIKSLALEPVYFPWPLETLRKLFIFHLDFVHMLTSTSSIHYITLRPAHLWAGVTGGALATH